jgi:hypothetical protein
MRSLYRPATESSVARMEGKLHMGKRCLDIALCLLAFGLAATAEADSQTPQTPPILDSDKLAPGVFTGTVVSTPNADRMFTVEVAYQKIQLKTGQNLGQANANLQREYNRILQLQNQLMQPGRRNNPAGTMQQLQQAILQFQVQLARAEANLFQVTPAKQKVDFQAEENVKVRLKKLPEDFDDKGNIKRYTAAELVKLKGKDKDLPGYESSVENLKVGQVVQITLRVHRKPQATPSTTPSSSSSADRGRDKDKDPDTPQHRLQVRMIMILKDGDGTATLQTPRTPSKSKNP